MKIIIETMRNLIKPVGTIACVLFTIYYLFALIGMFLFGGLVQQNLPVIAQDTTIPSTYYLDNFNDLQMSIVTLFTLMVVNNWMVQVQMYVDIMDHNRLYRLYFMLFYYFSVIIGINIVVAYAIDMYTSVERLEKDRIKSLKKIEEELLSKKKK